MTEAQIQKMMKALGVDRDEAISIIKDDENVDKMSMKEVTADMTEAQKKAAKKATITTGDKRKRTATTKRERKPDEVKREIIATIAQNLDRCVFEDDSTISNVVIANIEKEITFKVGEDEYSVTLTKHRKPKGE